METENRLDSLLSEVGTRADQDISQIKSDADQKKVDIILSEVAAQREVFLGLSEGYLKVCESPEIGDDLQFFKTHGSEGVDALPSRFQEQIKHSLGQLSRSFIYDKKAKVYVLPDSTVVFPLKHEDTKSKLGEFVYGLAVSTLKGSKEGECANGCIAFTGEEDLGGLVDALSGLEYNPLVVEQLDIDVRLDTTQHMLLKDLLERYGTRSFQKLYDGINTLGLEKKFRGRTRIFSHEDVERLDQYFSDKAGREYITPGEAADILDLSPFTIYDKVRDGRFKDVRREGRCILIPKDQVEAFKDAHIRMNMVYRSRRR